MNFYFLIMLSLFTDNLKTHILLQNSTWNEKKIYSNIYIHLHTISLKDKKITNKLVDNQHLFIYALNVRTLYELFGDT